MNEITTIGRPMTKCLQDAIDNLTGRQRVITRCALTEAAVESETAFARICAALVLELQLAELREAALFRALEEPPTGPHVDGIPDPPPLTGGNSIFRPDDE